MYFVGRCTPGLTRLFSASARVQLLENEMGDVGFFSPCRSSTSCITPGVYAIVGASAVLGTAHLFFGIRLLQLAEVALLALFLVWLVFEWLRRVLQAPLTLRLLAALAVPTVQAALVRLVYPLVPLEELVRDLATTSPPR